MIRRYLYNREVRYSAPKRQFDEDVVQNGLAVTPAEMMQMAEKGIPVSPQNLGLTYQEGVSKLDFTPPLEYTRGVDMNDLWEAQRDVKAKFRKAVNEHAAVTENNAQ